MTRGVERRWLLGAACVAMILLVVGCGSNGSSSGGDGGAEGGSGVSAVRSSACGGMEYGGRGRPDALIVSDLPLRGASAERSKQQVTAVRLALREAGWRAGSRSVAFQSCDDTIAKTKGWEAARCRANAKAYVADHDVVGVVGTYNSGCAAIEIPILDRAGVAMVSPGNTAVCLTQRADTCTGGEPGSLYPTGRRNYARVVPNDAVQGAGLAAFARGHGVTHPFVLYTGKDPTSLGQATAFRHAATKLGLHVAGVRSWDKGARSYGTLMDTVKRSGADGVVLAGLLEDNGARVIRDKVSALGPNDGPVKLLAFDGFAQQATIDTAGDAANGMFASVPGKAPSALTGAGKAFVAQLRKAVGGRPVELFAPYAGQATTVLLHAIAKGGGDRARTAAALFGMSISGGITGNFSIERTGDPDVAPITVSVAHQSFESVQQVAPPASLTTAARG